MNPLTAASRQTPAPFCRTKESSKENCRCFDAVRGCARGATVERSETGERTMIAPAGAINRKSVFAKQTGGARCAPPSRTAPWRGSHAPNNPNKVSSEKGRGLNGRSITVRSAAHPPLPPPLSRVLPRHPTAGGEAGPLVKGWLSPQRGEMSRTDRGRSWARRAAAARSLGDSDGPRVAHPFPGNHPPTAKGAGCRPPLPLSCVHFHSSP